MNFTVIIPFRDGHSSLPALLDSLPAGLPILVVDDQSEIAPDLKRWPQARAIRLRERGYFAGAVNAGMAAIDGDALILNQDVTLHGEAWRSWLAEQRDRYAVIGHGQMKHPAWPAGYVQGQMMYIRRDAWDATGPFNARDFPLWGCTAEWQARACRRGFRALPVADVAGLAHARPIGATFGASINAAVEAEPSRREWLIRTPPLISIIVTSHRYGRYLRDCIASLIGGKTSLGEMPGQSLQAFEIIIVDDGSSDETAEVGRALADPMQGIRYIRRAHNGGTPAANNEGIRASFGRYITILCADDMREPGSLDALYRVCEAHPKAVAYDYMIEFEHGARTVHREFGQYGFDSLVKKNMMHAGIMYPRRAWDETGGYHESMREGREDWQFNIALGLKGYCGRRVQEFGYLYRREGQNRSLGNSGPEWLSVFRGQLRAIWPALIEKGIKPMGCCGGSSNEQAASPGFGAAQGQSADDIGTEGMTQLEYLGGNSGVESWYGPAPRLSHYRFGGKRKFGWVDNRDVNYFLLLRENRRQIFALAPSSGGPEAAEKFALPVGGGVIPALDPADVRAAVLRLVGDPDPHAVPTEVAPVAHDPTSDLTLPIQGDGGQWVEGDPRSLSVPQIKAILAFTTTGQRARMLAMENESGKPRKGVVALLDKADA